MEPGFELDHIGIAVKNLEESFKFYKLMGWSSLKTETVESEKVKVGFIEFNNQVNIELLEATSDESPVAKFIAKRGAGIHHICFRVKNIREVMKTLKSSGVQLINAEPKMGAHNCLVAFIHPKSTGGVLIELSEKQNSEKQRDR